MDTYFACVPAWTRKSMICEELHMRRDLKLDVMQEANY